MVLTGPLCIVTLLVVHGHLRYDGSGKNNSDRQSTSLPSESSREPIDDGAGAISSVKSNSGSDLIFVADFDMDVNESAGENISQLAVEVPLTVIHNPKTGGAYIRAIIAKCVLSKTKTYNSGGGFCERYGTAPCRWTPGRQLQTPGTDNRSLVIGMVRDPFSMYVSLWTFNNCGRNQNKCCPKLTEAQDAELYPPRSRCFDKVDKVGSKPDERDQFRKWLSVVNHPEVGLASMRFYAKYVAPEKSERWIFKTARAFADGNGTKELMMEKFKQFEERKEGICFVYQNDIVNTLKTCLKKFERKGGRIDWKAFDVATSHGHYNGSPHSEIAKFYDETSISEVLTSDKELFSLFDFRKQP